MPLVLGHLCKIALGLLDRDPTQLCLIPIYNPRRSPTDKCSVIRRRLRHTEFEVKLAQLIPGGLRIEQCSSCYYSACTHKCSSLRPAVLVVLVSECWPCHDVTMKHSSHTHYDSFSRCCCTTACSHTQDLQVSALCCGCWGPAIAIPPTSAPLSAASSSSVDWCCEF